MPQEPDSESPPILIDVNAKGRAVNSSLNQQFAELMRDPKWRTAMLNQYMKQRTNEMRIKPDVMSGPYSTRKPDRGSWPRPEIPKSTNMAIKRPDVMYSPHGDRGSWPRPEVPMSTDKAIRRPDAMSGPYSIRKPDAMYGVYEPDGMKQMDALLKDEKFRRNFEMKVKNTAGSGGFLESALGYANPVYDAFMTLFVGHEIGKNLAEQYNQNRFDEMNARSNGDKLQALDWQYRARPENLSNVLNDYEEYKRLRDSQLLQEAKNNYERRQEDARAAASAEAFWRESERRRAEGIGPIPLDWQAQ